MIKNDKWIREQAAKGMISPYEPGIVRQVADRKVFSYGTGSYSYDLRLSGKEFKVFRHIPGSIVDPKNFNPQHLVDAELHYDTSGAYFILPANSYGLGVAVERLEVPENIQVVCMGKSSYARCFSGDTKVKLVDGDYTFLELMQKVQNGEKLYGYGVKNRTIEVQELIAPRFIENSELVRVWLDDGTYFDCTPDHQIMRRDGFYMQAQHLRAGTSLYPIYQHLSHGYPTIYDSVKADRCEKRQEGWTEVAKLVYEFLVRNNERPELPTGWHIHHRDENKLNNHPDNLEAISAYEHMLLHNLDERASKGGQKIKERYYSDEEYRNQVHEKLHSLETKEKAYQGRKAFLHSQENVENLARAKTIRWADPQQRIAQSEVAKRGIGAMHLRSDITEETLTAALLKEGTIRGAARLLNVDRSAFRRFPEVISKFKNNELCYNHKVAKVEWLKTVEPTYCLTAPTTGNFALSNGVFVSNCGAIVNMTPAEAGWAGHLTLEISNSSSADIRLYANEGICVLLFLEGEPCEMPYQNRPDGGKYQNQTEEVTFSRV
jgi:deoxycytidine triphosphate deaminase